MGAQSCIASAGLCQYSTLAATVWGSPSVPETHARPRIAGAAQMPLLDLPAAGPMHADQWMAVCTKGW